MTTSISANAEESAVPADLAEKAAALVAPGEAVLWAGRGRSGATFAALWPGAAVVVLLLALLVWLMLGFEGWTYRQASPEEEPLIPADVAARLTLGLFVAALSWMLVQFVRRVAGAPSTLAVLTQRRVLLRAGGRALGFPLADLTRAVVSGPPHRTALQFKIRKGAGAPRGLQPTLFGIANAGSAIEVLERLGVPVSDERDGPLDGPPPVAPGESIRWSGRRGAGAIGADRLLIVACCAPVSLIFFGLLWHIWSSAGMDAAGLAWGGLMTLALCMIMSGMIWLALAHGPAFLWDLYLEVFGRLAVTDRRILFMAPISGAVRRDIPADRILEAVLIDVDERGRGYISLTLKTKAGERDETMDLYSVPDPHNALDSIARLIRRP